MSEYFGLFLFLGIIIMAFWILIFLATFLGYWSVMGALNSIFPSLFEKKDAEPQSEDTTSTEA